MARTEASVVIHRPVDDVFRYVTDVRTWPQWAGFPEAEQVSDGPVGAGTTFRGVSEFLGRRSEWVSEVTTYEPNHRVEQDITWGGVHIRQSLSCEACEGGTRFTQSGEGEFGGLFKLAGPILSRRMQAQLEGNLARLKDILESEGQAST
jgi:uncharacterized protein YndB with AHSA1/START domain